MACGIISQVKYSAKYYDNAFNIVNDTLSEVGLDPLDASISSSADPAVKQMCRLLKSVCRELVYMHPWQQLTREYEFDVAQAIVLGLIDAGCSSVPLPLDYAYLHDNTNWDRANSRSISAVSPQVWQQMKASVAGNPFYLVYRLRDQQFVFQSTLPGTLVFRFEYVSRYTVINAGFTTSTELTHTFADTDIILFHPLLVVKLLKLRFLEAKGFDTTSALGQFNNAWEMVVGHEMPAPILDLTTGSRCGELGSWDQPLENIGS